MPCPCIGNCTCAFEAGDGIIITGSGEPGDPLIISSDGGGGGASSVPIQDDPGPIAPTCENRLGYNTNDELTFLPDGVEYIPGTALTLLAPQDIPIANDSAILYEQDFTNNSDCDIYVTVFNNVEVTLFQDMLGSGAPPLFYNARNDAFITTPANEIGGLDEWPSADIHLFFDPDSDESIVLDEDFGVDGFSGINSWALGIPWSVTIDSAGRVMAAVRQSGSIGAAQGVARLDTAGALDATWAGDGFFDTAQGNADVLIDSSNRVVSLGALGSAQFRRFTGAGVLDAAFGTAGVATVTIGGQSFHGDILLEQSDGKYLGFGGNGDDLRLLGARLTSTGALDGTYGTAGVINIVQSTAGDNMRGAIQSDDFPVLLTTGNEAVRLDTVGALDATYGVAGVQSLVGTIVASNIVIDNDDFSLIVGSDTEPAIVRLDTTGALDTAFAGTGKFEGAFANEIGAAAGNIGAVGLLSSGKIVVAGNSPATNDVLIAVLNDNGTLDTSFFGTGSTAVSVGDAGEPVVYDLFAQDNGEIVISGQLSSGSDSFFIRLEPTASVSATSNIDSANLRSTFLLPAGATETYTVRTNTDFLNNCTGLLADGNSIVHSAHAKYEPVRVGGFNVAIS